MSEKATTIELLGCSLRLVFDHEQAFQAALELCRQFPNAANRTPDIELRCAWPTLDRRYLRDGTEGGREKPLEGISVKSHGVEMADWSLGSPPFPPVELEPLRNRFVRLHAAALRRSTGDVLLIVGESGYGKSTLSRQLCRDHGYELLSDEDTFLYRRSTVVAPFPVGTFKPREVDGREVVDVVTPEVPLAKVSGSIDMIVFLSARQLGRFLVPCPDEAAVRSLLLSQRNGGSSTLEGVCTLLALAANTPAYFMQGADYTRLVEAAEPLARAHYTRMLTSAG